MKKALPLLFATFLCGKITAQGFSGNTYTNSEQRFIENRGQIADQNGCLRDDIYFETVSHGVELFIGKNGLNYMWQCHEPASDKEKLKGNIGNAEYYRIDVRLLNTLLEPGVQAEQPSADYINYYLPQCPQGVTDVHSYARVTLKNIYNNIDWTFYTNKGELEYDFIIKPGGNVNEIALQIEGAQKLELTRQNVLLIESPLGTCEQPAPATYQNGRLLPSHFVLDGNIIRIQVENYDPTVALIIDPMLKMWGTYYGGTNDELVNDLKTDGAGNVYIAGNTQSNTNISTGTFQSNLNSAQDGFVVKFSPAGQRIWSTYYGGDSIDNLIGCSIDGAGNVFLSGTTWSPSGIAFNGYRNSLNTYPTNYQQPGTACDGFLVKLNSNGYRQWGTYIGSTQGTYDTISHSYKYYEAYDQAFGCATDISGNVFVCGKSDWMNNHCVDESGNIIPCNNTYISTTGCFQDTAAQKESSAFLLKFDNNGNRLWGTYYGNTDDWIFNQYHVYCATDRAGNVYLGSTTPDTTGRPNLAYNGQQNQPASVHDAWFVKFSPTGSRLWASYYGGYADEGLNGICTDSVGNVTITGYTASTNNGNVIATSGGFMTNLLSGTFYNAFLANFNSNGQRRWGTYYGDHGSPDLKGYCTADNNGTVTLTWGASFQTVDNVVDYCGENLPSPFDGFVATRFTLSGYRIWSEVFTGRYGTPLCATSKDGKLLYLANTCYGNNAQVTSNSYQNSNGGGNDGFLLCYRDTLIYDTIRGHVFNDQNANGIEDNGETGLANTTVRIYVQNLSYTALTDASGFYNLIFPAWGFTGSCTSNLTVSLSSQAVTMPFQGYYSGGIVDSCGNCDFDFGIAPAGYVSGNIYYDNNHDGSLTSGEPGINSQSVSFNNQRQAFTDQNGNYYATLPIGNYTETFDKLDAYNSCISSPASIAINIGTGYGYPGRNFGAYFSPSFVNTICNAWRFGIPPVVGRICSWNVRIANNGTIATPDTVIFNYDPQLQYLNGAPGAIVNSINHSLTFITRNIAPARFADYIINFQVPSSITPGTILHQQIIADPDSIPDTDSSNNVVNLYERVLSSFDPNHKTANTNSPDPEIQVAHSWSNGNDEIQYQIDFQNTGTYNALNIVITDTLASQLDATTVRIIASSHNCAIQRTANVLNFKFSGIMLPDNADNEDSSKGYIVFKVKTKSNAHPGDSIINSASIYFDYNSGVVTNRSVIHLIRSGACNGIEITDLYDTVCVFHNYVFDGDTITRAGVYIGDTVLSSFGCDSVTILHVTTIAIPNSSIIRLYRTVCANEPYNFYGRILTASGVYQDTISCDSLIVLFINFVPYLSKSLTDTVCDFLPYHFGNKIINGPPYYWNGPGYTIQYYDTLLTAGGCDSFLNLRLYYKIPIYIFQDTICSTAPYIFGNDTINPLKLVGFDQYGYFQNYPPHLTLYDTTHLASGCDSAAIVYLTIKFNSFTNYSAYASVPCSLSGAGIGSPHQVHADISYNETTAANGCSNLTIYSILNQLFYSSITICSGDSVRFGQRWLKTQGTYIDTLTSACGEDSIVHLQLWVQSEIQSSRYIWICPGETTVFNGVNYSHPGSYTQIDSSNCPRIRYSITVLYEGISSIHTSSPSNCPGDYIQLHSGNYTIYQHPFNDTISYEESTNCPGDTGRLDTAVYIYYYHDNSNCPMRSEFDSVRFPNCHDSLNGYLHIRAWNGIPPYSYKWSTGDTTIELTGLGFGQYKVTVYDAVGDSSVPGDGFINGYPYSSLYHDISPDISTSELNIFEPSPIISYYIYFPTRCFEPNNDQLDINFNWFDFPVIISEKNISDTIRGMGIFGGKYFNHISPGRHDYVLTNSVGCTDSFSIIVPGDKIKIDNVQPQNCNGSGSITSISYNCYNLGNPLITLDINGYGQTLSYHQISGTDTLYDLSAGTHYYTAYTSTGCSVTDSFYVPSFSIDSGIVMNINANYSSVCDSATVLVASANSNQVPLSFVWNTGATTDNITVMGTGLYSVTATNAAGCMTHASISVEKTVLLNTFSLSLCNGDSVAFGTNFIHDSGTYTDTLTSVGGCDSIVTLHLTRNGLLQTTFWDTICAGEAINLNGNYYHQNGTYTDTLISAYGCDSIIKLYLTVRQLQNVSITISDDTLSTAVFSTYQWYKNGTLINGATQQVLLISESGNYSVAVTGPDGCSDTSLPVHAVWNNINTLANEGIRLYPNPNTGRFILEFDGSNTGEVEISDATGRIMERETISNHATLQLSTAASGLYFVRLKLGDRVHVIKMGIVK